MCPSSADPPLPSSEDLRRELVEPQRRDWKVAWLAGACASAGVLAFALLNTMPAPPTVQFLRMPGRVIVTPAPPAEVRTVVVQAAPVVAAPAVGARGACPAPVTTAPRGEVRTPPEDVDMVRPSSTDARWIAAWRWDRAYASRDGGHTFREVLDGPGTIRDVAFDCYGNVLVLRGPQLGVRTVDGAERWGMVPGLELGAPSGDPAQRADRGDDSPVPPFDAKLLDGGPDIAIVGSASRDEGAVMRVAISDSLGATWHFRDLTSSVASSESRISGRAYADGHLAVGIEEFDCDYAGTDWYAVTATGLTVDAGLPASTVVTDRVLLHSDAWYGPGGQPGLVIDGLVIPENDELVPIAGPYPLVVNEDRVYRVRAPTSAHGPSATRLPVLVGGEHPIADASGRIWTVLCHRRLHVATGSAPDLTCD